MIGIVLPASIRLWELFTQPNQHSEVNWVCFVPCPVLFSLLARFSPSLRCALLSLFGVCCCCAASLRPVCCLSCVLLVSLFVPLSLPARSSLSLPCALLSFRPFCFLVSRARLPWFLSCPWLCLVWCCCCLALLLTGALFVCVEIRPARACLPVYFTLGSTLMHYSWANIKVGRQRRMPPSLLVNDCGGAAQR